MIKLFKKLHLLFLIIIINAAFLRGESVERTWALTCRVLNCKQSLDFCLQMNCLGETSCVDCINTFFPSCVDCSNQILSSAININGESHILCSQSEPLHLTTCAFFCRSKNMVSSTCGFTNNSPLCSCSEYQNGTIYTTTTTTTTTTKPTTTIATTTRPSTQSSTAPTLLSQPYSNSLF